MSEKQFLIDFLNSSNRSQLCNLVVLTPFTDKELRILKEFLMMKFPDFEAKETILTNLITKWTEIPRDEYSYVSIVDELDHFIKMFDLEVDWDSLVNESIVESLAGQLVSDAMEVSVDHLKKEVFEGAAQADPVSLANESLPHDFQETTNSQVTNSQIQNESLPSQFQLGDSLPSEGADISMEHQNLAELPLDNIQAEMEVTIPIGDVDKRFPREVEDPSFVSAGLPMETVATLSGYEKEITLAIDQPVTSGTSGDTFETATANEVVEMQIEEVGEGEQSMLDTIIIQEAVLDVVETQEGIDLAIENKSRLVVEEVTSQDVHEFDIGANEAANVAPAAENLNALDGDESFERCSTPTQADILAEPAAINLITKSQEKVEEVLDSQKIHEVAQGTVREFDLSQIQFASPAVSQTELKRSQGLRDTTPTPICEAESTEGTSQNYFPQSPEKVDIVLDSQRVGEVAEDSVMEFDDSQIQFASPGPKQSVVDTPSKSMIVNISEPPTATSVRFQEVVGVIENNGFDDEINSEDEMKSVEDFENDFGASQSLYYDSQPSIMTQTGITAPNPTPIASRREPKTEISNHDQLKPLDDCWNTLRSQLYVTLKNTDVDYRVQHLSSENQEKGIQIAKLEQELEGKVESISNLAATFAENRSELNQMRNQVQVDLESAQLNANTEFCSLKDQLEDKLREIKEQYQTSLNTIDAQRQVEVQEVTEKYNELLPMKERVAELTALVETLQNMNVDLGVQMKQSLSELESLKAMEIEHSKYQIERKNLEDSFNFQFAQKQAEVENLNVQLQSLHSHIADLKTQLEVASDKLKSPSSEETAQLLLKVQFYEKKIADLSSTIEFSQQEQEVTSEALKEVSDQKTAVEKKLEELNVKYQELQSNYSIAQTNLDSVNADIDSRIEQVRVHFVNQLESSSEENRTMESRYLKLDQSHSALLADLKKKTEIIETLESERGSEAEKISALLAEREKLSEESRSKSVALDGALAEIASLSRKYDASVAKNLELEHFLAEKTNTAVDALSECKKLEDKLEALEKAKAEMKSELDQLAVETKLLSDSKLEELVKEIESYKLQVNELKGVSAKAIELEKSNRILEEDKMALTRQRDEINAQNSNFVKENATLKQNIQKLMEDMVKAKESAMKKSSNNVEESTAPVPLTTTRPNKKRPLGNSTMLSIPEDKNSPMRFQPAEAPESKKSKPSPKNDEDIQIIEPAKPAPVKRKKRRESTSLDQIQQLRDENSAPDTNGDKDLTPVKNSLQPVSTPDSASSIRRSRSSTTTMFIGLSGFKDSSPIFNYKARDDIVKAIKKLPNAKFLTGNEGKDHYDHRMTHIITPPETKTLKALGAILSGAWVIQDPEWIYRSVREGKWVPEEEYGFHLTHSPFLGKSIYMTPTFASLSSGAGKKQNSMWPEFLKLLWVDCSKGSIVGTPKNADYVIKTDTDEDEYGRVTVLDWHSFMDLIPSKRLV